MDREQIDLALHQLQADGAIDRGFIANILREYKQSLAPGEAVAEVESWVNGSYERKYKLRWLRDVEAGTTLYASPQPSAETVVDPETFEKALERIINGYSMESASNTPDWILAQYLRACLLAFDTAVQQRETWYGRAGRPSAAAQGGYWWCAHCKVEVGSYHVTYQELHEDCGYPVEWITNADRQEQEPLGSRRIDRPENSGDRPQTPAASASYGEQMLPELPKPWALHCGYRYSQSGAKEMFGEVYGPDTDNMKRGLYTAEQMRDYATAARSMDLPLPAQDELVKRLRETANVWADYVELPGLLREAADALEGRR